MNSNDYVNSLHQIINQLNNNNYAQKVRIEYLENIIEKQSFQSYLNDSYNQSKIDCIREKSKKDINDLNSKLSKVTENLELVSKTANALRTEVHNITKKLTEKLAQEKKNLYNVRKINLELKKNNSMLYMNFIFQKKIIDNFITEKINEISFRNILKMIFRNVA